MRAVGIDVASTGFSGIALAVDGEPRRAVVWQPPDKRDTVATHILQHFQWIQRTLWVMKPDVIAVEELAVFQNKKVIRALSRHEGISILAAKMYGAMVVNPPVSKSRQIVFGKGNMSKDQCWAAFPKMYPDLELLPKLQGGLDQMDAYTHALAAPTVLERR